jgi:hypothetical protein
MIFLLLSCSGDKDELSEFNCRTKIPIALQSCISNYSLQIQDCYVNDDQNCSQDDSKLQQSIHILEETISQSCQDRDFGNLSVSDLVGRMQNACVSESNSMGWRVYGGPQGAVWKEVSTEEQVCLQKTHEQGISFVNDSLSDINICLQESCDVTTLEEQRQDLKDSFQEKIDQDCGNLQDLIAIDSQTYMERLEHQIDCITSTAQVDTQNINLTCGPSNAEFDVVRGEWQQIVVDGNKWGTMCGDGSDYAFLVKFAPEGELLDNILIGLQGGGVCVFEGDCSAKLQSTPDLFEAMNDQPFEVGIVSNDPEESPFANWTKVYLPYCTQDVFIGGGVDEDLGSMSLPRYGAVNLRSAVMMFRDALWKEMDATESSGFRPDQLTALFGGWSAGAYGTIYNYHWFLDDLQWTKTIAFPDAGMALHNGETLGVLGLGLLKIPAWGSQSYLPPYCFQGECAVGPNLYEAISPRLKQVPEQQILVLSNPKDLTQQGDAYFSDEAHWINTVRQSYCDTKDLNGIHYYFTSISDQSLHCVSIRPQLWQGSVDGEVMADWFARAVYEPDNLRSRVEEANFVNDIEGVEPYPCDVPE